MRPMVVLGAAEGDLSEEHFRVRPPFLLTGGRVVVPLAGYAEIRVFSLDGELLVTHGRPGEGPGEYRDLERAWARGDTIEVFDRRLMRITRIYGDGTPEIVRLSPAGGRPTAETPGSFKDGWALTGITSSLVRE